MQETDGIVRTKVKNMRLCQMIQRGECEACAHHGTVAENWKIIPIISMQCLPTSPVTFTGVWLSKYGSLIIVACVKP